jgi:signal transduction histidine kinase
MTENILQRLQESQERFLSTPSDATYFLQTILQSMHEGIVFINLDGIITLINPYARKTLNLTISGSRFWDILPDEYFGFSMKEAIHFGISHKLLYRNILSKELEISTIFFSQGSKSSHGLIIWFRDITEKKQLQRQSLLNERMSALGSMLSSIAHEIKNPLGGIRGYASLLYRDLASQKHLQEMANHIVDGTKSLERLISQILNYAKPIRMNPESTEIGQFLRSIIQFMKQDPACNRSIHWQVHIPDEPLIAPIDRESMKSALINLILNAFQAMPMGGTLTLSLFKMDSCYQIAISDTGIGMDEEMLKKIFSPFFTTKDQGNGLGLVQVHKIVQGHYGTIDVRSFLLKGTTFTLNFPLKRSYD